MKATEAKKRTISALTEGSELVKKIDNAPSYISWY